MFANRLSDQTPRPRIGLGFRRVETADPKMIQYKLGQLRECELPKKFHLPCLKSDAYFSEGPHKGTIDSHQLLSIDLIRLVQNHSNFIVETLKTVFPESHK